MNKLCYILTNVSTMWNALKLNVRLFFQCWFGNSLRKYPVQDWSIEQKWISVLLPLLMLYNSQLSLELSSFLLTNQWLSCNNISRSIIPDDVPDEFMVAWNGRCHSSNEFSLCYIALLALCISWIKTGKVNFTIIYLSLNYILRIIQFISLDYKKMNESIFTYRMKGGWQRFTCQNY